MIECKLSDQSGIVIFCVSSTNDFFFSSFTSGVQIFQEWILLKAIELARKYVQVLLYQNPSQPHPIQLS